MLVKRVVSSCLALVFAAAASLSAETTYAPPYAITTLAGHNAIGAADGIGTDARFSSPSDVGADSAGNVYVADTYNHTIRKITPGGVVSVFAGLAESAGAADGTGNAARFNRPYRLAVDSSGNVYVTELDSYLIRKITPGGVVTSIPGIPGVITTETAGVARSPTAIAVDRATDEVYVAYVGAVCKLKSTGGVTLIAGSLEYGVGVFAHQYLSAIQVGTGGVIYVADRDTRCILKIATDGTVTNFAGTTDYSIPTDGTGSDARFADINGMTTDGAGNLYVTELTVRKITPAAVVTTIAGHTRPPGSTDGPISEARFLSLNGITVDQAGNLYVVDGGNHKIRKIDQTAQLVTTFAGALDSYGAADGAGSAAQFKTPRGMAMDSHGNYYVADQLNHTIRKITPDGTVTTFAGGMEALYGQNSLNDGTGTAARFADPRAVAIDAQDNLYVADYYTVRKVTPTRVVTTIAGVTGNTGWADDVGDAARFNALSGIAVDASGNVFVADSYNHVIRKITPDRTVTTIAGEVGVMGSRDGTGSAARFNVPMHLAIDGSGILYVSDTFNRGVRKITPDAVVSTLAGSAQNFSSTDGVGSAAGFQAPGGLAVDSDGNVYVGDIAAVRRITRGGVVTTLAGNLGELGYKDATGAAARFNRIEGLVRNAAGELIFADYDNYVIRKAVSVKPLVLAHSATRQVLLPGDTLNLSVTATANGSPTYQWFHDGRPIAGATGSSLTRSNVTYADRGAYWLEITDTAGTTQSVPMFAMIIPSQTQILGWGESNFGELNLPKELTRVADIKTGVFHALALKSDGTIRAWGNSANGATTVPTGLTDVVAIGAGDSFSVALKSDGTVVAWGSNLNGRTNVPAGLDQVVGIAVDSFYTLALKADGTVVAWGAPGNLLSHTPAGLTDVATVSAGITHAVVVKRNGSVLAWGSDNSWLDATNSLSGITTVAAGTYYSVALKSDGTVSVVVPPAFGPTYMAAPAGLNGVVSVKAGYSNAIAIKSDGTLRIWKSGGELLPFWSTDVLTAEALNSFGLILRDASHDAAPSIDFQSDSTTVTENNDLNLGVSATGAGPLYYQWRKDGVNIAGATSSLLQYIPTALTDAGTYDVVVTNHRGSVTSAPITVTINPIPVVTPVGLRRRVLTPGQSTQLSVSATGTGSLSYQWIHNGKPVAGAMSAVLSVDNVNTVSAGWYAVDVTDSNGTRRSAPFFIQIPTGPTRVEVWGYITNGQNIIPSGLNNVMQVAAGDSHALALRANGTVVAWGEGSYPVLNVPQDLNDVVAISSGPDFALALRSDGTVTGWGDNSKHQLNIPANLTDVVAISTGTTFGVALKSNGSVVTWGDDALIIAATNIVAISARGTRCLALRDNGTVLETGYHPYSWNDMPAGLNNVIAIAAGNNHSLALKADHTVAAWGTYSESWIPQPAGLTGVAALTAGLGDSMALLENGTIVTWGYDHTGESGPLVAKPASAINIKGIATGRYWWIVFRDATANETATDFNGNGKPDLVLQNLTTGERAVRLMNGTTAGSEVSLGTLSNQWVIATTADFNSDGQPDLLLQNRQTGERKIRLMNGTTADADVALGSVPVEWSMVAAADFNGDGKADILWQNTTTGERHLWFMNGSVHIGDAGLGIVSLEWSIATAADFNGDGKADILWQNTANGERYLWFMNGSTHTGDVSLGLVPRDWFIAGAADYNGDGKIDILWQNTTTRQCYVWYMNGSAHLGDADLGVLPADWSLAGVPVPALPPTPVEAHDFNGDGKADILWQNTANGERYLWFMNGATKVGEASLGIVPLEWSLVANADFNADGKSDLLWQNTTTGQRYLWFMNGTTRTGEASLGIVPVEWSLAATADFNGDSKPDLLWQNTTTGERYFWFMNGSTRIGEASLGIVPLEWSLAVAGDFNGDSKPDLLWQNTANGERYLWFMNGTTRIGETSLGLVPLEWSLAATADFNGDGKADLLWQNTVTGQRYLWFMNGTARTGEASLGTVPLAWRIVH